MDPAPTTDLAEHLPGHRLERFERHQLLALDTAFELNPAGHLPSCPRQRDAPALSDADDQENQIPQMRLVKARDQTFRAQPELICYCPEIHFLAPLVVCSQQLREAGMYLISSYKMRPPVK